MPRRPGEITELLNADPSSAPSSPDELWERVYPELRRRARNLFRGERPDHTLSATAVVNELFVRLAHDSAREWKDRTHFYAACSGIMRHVLIDHARGRAAGKRGGGAVRESLDESVFAAVPASEEGFQVASQALEQLADKNERAALVVAFRVFGGLTVEEVAEELGVSERTVKSDWVLARARLRECAARAKEADLHRLARLAELARDRLRRAILAVAQLEDLALRVAHPPLERAAAVGQRARGVDATLRGNRGRRDLHRLGRVERDQAGRLAPEAPADLEVHDPEHPGEQRRLALEGGQAAVHLEEDVLGHVLGLGGVAQPAARECVDAAVIALVELREAALVPCQDARNQRLVFSSSLRDLAHLGAPSCSRRGGRRRSSKGEATALHEAGSRRQSFFDRRGNSQD